MSDVNEIARAIVEQMNDGETSTSLADELARDRLQALIAAALASERAKFAAIRAALDELRAARTNSRNDNSPGAIMRLLDAVANLDTAYSAFAAKEQP